jgi:hypothetical protein
MKKSIPLESSWVLDEKYKDNLKNYEDSKVCI